MVISPCLLDFLEQALEPIPMGITMLQQSKKGNSAQSHLSNLGVYTDGITKINS